MQDLLGIGLFAFGVCLIASGLAKRRKCMRVIVRPSDIRLEFAAMGANVRPIILFGIGLFALKLTLFFFVFGEQRFLTPLAFAGLMSVLAAYVGWLVIVTSGPIQTSTTDVISSGKQTVA